MSIWRARQPFDFLVPSMLPVIPAASSVKPSTKAQLDILLENIEVSILFLSYTELTVRDKLNNIIYY